MSNAFFKVRPPVNEPIKSYGPSSKEKAEVKQRLQEMRQEVIEIPLIIGGKEVKTGNLGEVREPHNRQSLLATYHMAGENEVKMAIEAAMEAKAEWDNTPWEHRVAVFLKAAELLTGPWRATMNAATMLGQSKTIYQAEIEAVCELADFLRFNAHYLTEIYQEQPESTLDAWNRMEWRSLEGFIFAVTPFNFTAIAGNLPSSPAMMGNTVVWKPASSAVFSNYYLMKLLQEAGLPDGVINFLPGPGMMVGDLVLEDPRLAGIHFTGSTAVFQHMWQIIGLNLKHYHVYPRLVGETGGKDFVFAHPTAQVDSLVTALIRGAFEYQGQKCSAASRAYIPESLWGEVKEKLVQELATVKMGDVTDFTNFMNAVIDRNAFDGIKEYIDYAANSDEASFLWGGKCDDSKGYFIEPTVILTTNPHFKTMREEIFGPVLTIYVYADQALGEAVKLCDTSTPYGLTGAIFAQDRAAIVDLEKKLMHTAGNFYINDKPTGAVVGQQPFGGSRASGTNDKAGSKINLLRWVTPRVIKENLVPPTSYRYSFMDEE